MQNCITHNFIREFTLIRLPSQVGLKNLIRFKKKHFSQFFADRKMLRYYSSVILPSVNNFSVVECLLFGSVAFAGRKVDLSKRKGLKSIPTFEKYLRWPWGQVHECRSCPGRSVVQTFQSFSLFSVSINIHFKEKFF